MKDWRKSIYTLSVHAEEKPKKGFGAINTPQYDSSVFILPDAMQGAKIHQGEQDGYFYGRMGNPTQTAFEKAMCLLEQGEAALAFASGMAAISSLSFTLLKPGDHMVAPLSMYATSFQLFSTLFKTFGIQVTFIDSSDPQNYRNASKQNTKVFYLETPSNPLLGLTDIKAVTQIAKTKKIFTVLDNTFATPFNQNPLLHGVDVVIHSASKYLGGHGDVLAGVIIGSQKIIKKVRWQTGKLLGGAIAPHAASLLLRGLKTLALRMERHNFNALNIATFLDSHPKVKKVCYPGLTSNPQYQLACRQMRGFGGMVTFDVGGIKEGQQLVNNLKLCSLAVSLGDVATLIQHSASMTHANIAAETRRKAGISDGLIRMSVGIENADDIKSDLERGLSFINQ